VQRYIDGIVEATARVKGDKPGSVSLLKSYLGSDDDVAVGAAYDFHVVEVLATLPFPRPEQFADAIEQLSTKNPRVLEVDLATVLDPSFVQDAADRGLGG
jgi:hypothetical protein